MAKDDRGKPVAERFFLVNIVSRTNPQGEVESPGPATDQLWNANGTPFWPEGTSKSYVDYAGKNYTLCKVTHAKSVPIPVDPDIFPMPEFSPDAKVQSMHGPTLQAMKNAMTARGISPAFVDGVDGYREVIRKIGQTLKVDFDESYFGL